MKQIYFKIIMIIMIPFVFIQTLKSNTREQCIGIDNTFDLCMGIIPCDQLNEVQCNECSDCEWTTEGPPLLFDVEQSTLQAFYFFNTVRCLLYFLGNKRFKAFQ